MKGIMLFFACLLLVAPAAFAEIVARPDMGDCERRCVDLYAPSIDQASKDSRATYGERRSRVFQARDQLNACLQACTEGGGVVVDEPVVVEPAPPVVEEEVVQESGPPAHAPARGRR